MPDDDDNAVPFRPAGVPPEAFIPGAGGGGIPTPGYDPTVPSPGHDRVVVPWQVPPAEGYPPTHPFGNADWVVSDTAVDFLAERTGIRHATDDADAAAERARLWQNDARSILDTWLRQGKIGSNGAVSYPGVTTKIVPLTIELWRCVAPLTYGSTTRGIGDFSGIVVRGIEVFVPDLLAAVAGLAGDPLLPTQPVSAAPQAAADATPADKPTDQQSAPPMPTERENRVYKAALKECQKDHKKGSKSNIRDGLFFELRKPPLCAKRDEVEAAAAKIRLQHPKLLRPGRKKRPPNAHLTPGP
jgi:hypothetical protein